MNPNISKHTLCANCGHYYFLHEHTFNYECLACDTPEVPLDKRCEGFKE